MQVRSDMSLNKGAGRGDRQKAMDGRDGSEVKSAGPRDVLG